ncbi:MAG: antibiotic biosynthesis monooxygenase [Chloroflexi bacterium]|nr:antibiotic biosynthesis monooxygenase [Chloroflexota bacterium]
MVTMTKDNNLYNVLVRYTIEPSDQAELVDVLKRAAHAFEPLPGFVSLTMHRGMDDKQIVVYLQWRSKADSDACASNPIWLASGQELYEKFIIPGRATMEPQAFEIVYQLEGAAQGVQ